MSRTPGHPLSRSEVCEQVLEEEAGRLLAIMERQEERRLVLMSSLLRITEARA